MTRRPPNLTYDVNDAELQITHEIQEKFLPKKSPTVRGFDIHAITIPARELGGDFYDFITISDSLTGLVIADVSGKSIPAALFMALSTTSIRASAVRDINPDHVIQNANNLIFKYTESGMFISIWYGIIESDNNHVWYTNAGHPPPILFRNDGTSDELIRTGPIAGFLENEPYMKREILFNTGDILICYTDGVTESRKVSGEMYGKERIHSVISNTSELSSKEICEAIFKDINRFMGEEPQYDDITLLVIKKN